MRFVARYSVRRIPDRALPVQAFAELVRQMVGFDLEAQLAAKSQSDDHLDIASYEGRTATTIGSHIECELAREVSAPSGALECGSTVSFVMVNHAQLVLDASRHPGKVRGNDTPVSSAAGYADAPDRVGVR